VTFSKRKIPTCATCFHQVDYMKEMAESFMRNQSNQICREEKVKMVTNALAPNGGTGEFSYSKNSYFQVHTPCLSSTKLRKKK